MIRINSNAWVRLFLFYGVVCFGLGFGGYLVKPGRRSPAPSVRAPFDNTNHNHDRRQRLPVLEPERYFAGFLTGLSSIIAGVPGLNDQAASKPLKAGETVPALAKIPPASLWFCFPANHTGPFRSLLTRTGENLRTYFPRVEAMPITAGERWEEKLAARLTGESPVVFIGVNLADSGSKPGETGVNMHLYFSMPFQWRQLFLQQVIPRCSADLNAFTFGKRRVGTGEIFELEWPEAAGADLAVLEQNLDLIIKVLGQLQALQSTKKI